MRAPPILRILGGIFFILAGLLSYYKLGLALSFPLLFVAAGAAVVLIAITRHRATGGDIALFVVALLVLGGVTSGLAIDRTQTVTYSGTKTGVNARELVLKASANFSSIDISFSNRKDLAYQVNFTGSTPFFPFGAGQPTFSNRTANGVLILQAQAGASAISVLLGEGYFTNITASTGAGSIDLTTLGRERLGRVSLSTGAGSINALLTVAGIGELRLSTGSGSISLTSDHLVPESPRVPVSLSSGLGSVSIDLSIPKNSGVTISASAGLGTISQNLPGFSVTSSPGKLNATTGDLSGNNPSLEISASTGTGAVSLESRLV